VEEWEEENHCPISLRTTRGTVTESHLLCSKPNPHLGGIWLEHVKRVALYFHCSIIMIRYSHIRW